jgi:hypothetical protein
MTSKRYPRSSSYSSPFQRRTQGLSVQISTGFTKGNPYPNSTRNTFPG